MNSVVLWVFGNPRIRALQGLEESGQEASLLGSERERKGCLAQPKHGICVVLPVEAVGQTWWWLRGASRGGRDATQGAVAVVALACSHASATRVPREQLIEKETVSTPSKFEPRRWPGRTTTTCCRQY